MKLKFGFIFLPALFLLYAFVSRPEPLFAFPLPEGRTLDEGHDAGFIDWSGSVGYVNLRHRDALCPSGCWEQVTRIDDGSSVSGAFAGDVTYFEVMAAFTHDSAAGTAVLNACGSSGAWYLYIGPGRGAPGFASLSIPVPAGCRGWSLSASGGYVDFRSVDANYVSPPPPVATNTFTPAPTATFSPTGTMTPTLTATETLTPTAIETLLPDVTPSDTPTLTDTPSPTSTALSASTLTSTPSTTLPPGVTPSDTPVPSNTPISPAPTDTPVQPPPSNGGQGGNPPVIPYAPFSTAAQIPSAVAVLPMVTATPRLVVQVVPTTISKTSTPARVSIAAPTLSSVTLPTEPLACIPSAGSDFPWWILPAGMTIASALSLLGSFLKNLDTASVTLGDLSFSPFGVTVPIPHRVPHKTTVGEWVMRPVRTLVQITRTIWKTITEAIPRFITRARQVIDHIVHSEWVTTFRRVAKTFWENVTEKVPLFGFLGKVIGFIWKTVVKPVIRWVTEAIRTLRTWVERVVRTIVEKIQDGWNYITRQVSETIREWVEKTDWVRDWVTKEITVWETVWALLIT